ncbi:27 kDa hemolymph glycoprotein-like [Diprion similis]|uniref:27 kDa hemolymph glycoprotein-like n=1 Tax=Diprion similis TaxID=362088 RepID=UPI001EF93A1D|nr:27 kDa hemolymph glycoprotein-like [Diprion similis]
MKILLTFGFFLVAGILNSNIAQAENPKTPAVKEKYVELLGKVKVNPLSEYDSDEYDEELVKAKCNKNGGPTAYNTAVQGLADLQNTIESIINSTDNSVEVDASDDSSSEELTSDDFGVICLSIHILKTWVIKGIDAIKPCLDQDERQAIELLVNISYPVIDYVCENNGSNLIGFFETGGAECLEEKSDSLEECFSNSTSAESIESTEVTTISSPTAAIPKPFDLPQFAVDVEDCTEFETVQNCIVGKLNGCSQRTPSNFVNSIFNIIKRESGCRAVLKARAEQASEDL